MNEPCVDEALADSYRDALGFLYDRINYERMSGPTDRYPFRLQRIRILLGRLGLGRFLYQLDGLDQREGDSVEDPRTTVPLTNPTTSIDPVPLVHIAGTKGKGSVATMVAGALTAAGQRTGLYTSPHLTRLEERFRVDGKPCTAAELISLVDQIRPVVEQLSEESAGPSSFFELTTALALLHFSERECDAIVLEVGLGGRLDSTNVCRPSVSVITSIGLDHQQVLGDTVELIAAEKAGIIKADVPVVCGVSSGAAADVIREIAEQRHATLYQIGRDFTARGEVDPEWGANVSLTASRPPLLPSQEFHLNLEGEHQVRNAAVAAATLDLLRSQGVAVGADDFANSMATLRCESRIERFRLGDGVTGIVDAAHNGDSVEALCECLRRRFGERAICVVFGTSRDKTAEPMLASLSELADEIVLTQFTGNPRFRTAASLVDSMPAKDATSYHVEADPIEAVEHGWRRVTPGGALVVCGSFFLAAEIRPWIMERSEQEGG